jgi:predicted nucleotide-binding protein (sugar kinase/HSP70/actin superfamily)
MNNITIGIPESMFYYDYKYLLTTFFKELGINIVLGKSNGITKLNVCYPINVFFSCQNRTRLTDADKKQA